MQGVHRTVQFREASTRCQVFFSEDHVNDNNASRLLAPKAAAAATNLSRSALYYMAEKGQFPAPVRISDRRVAFVRAEVEAWIDARIAGRAAA